jgi:hypothetical protein
VGELRVSVVYEESEAVLVAEVHDKGARLLCRPASIGIRRGGDVIDPSWRRRDEEQHVDPFQECRLDVRKSQASMLPACARRNARQDESVRSGAG